MLTRQRGGLEQCFVWPHFQKTNPVWLHPQGTQRSFYALGIVRVHKAQHQGIDKGCILLCRIDSKEKFLRSLHLKTCKHLHSNIVKIDLSPRNFCSFPFCRYTRVGMPIKNHLLEEFLAWTIRCIYGLVLNDRGMWLFPRRFKPWVTYCSNVWVCGYWTFQWRHHQLKDTEQLILLLFNYFF